MKNLLIQLTSIASLLAATGASGADAAGIPRDQVQGKVRCVLMSVGQTTVFPNDNPVEPFPGLKSGVPCLTITYLVERLGDEPFQAVAVQKVEMLSGGKPIKLVNSRSGTCVKNFDYRVFPPFLDFTKPKVADPTRAVVVQYVEFAALPNLKPVDVVITAGFDTDLQTFRFSSVGLQ